MKIRCISVFIISVAVLFYLISLYRFSMPFADDFGFMDRARLGLDPIDVAMQFYYFWNGRLVANFFFALFCNELNFNSYRLIAFICGIIMFTAIFTFIWKLMYSFPAKIKIFTAVIYLAFLCISMPSIRDSLYWMGVIANYTIGIIAFTFAAILLLQDRLPLRPYFSISAGVILIAISSLCNEAFTIAGLWFLLVITGIAFYKKETYRSKIALLYTMTMFTGLLIMYFCPGNEIRYLGNEPQAGNLIWALYKSLMVCLERSAEWMFLTPLLPTALVFSQFTANLKLPKLKNTLSLKTHGILLIFFGITCNWAAHFTMTYARGYVGLPSRAKFMAMFFFMPLCMAGLLYIFKHYELDKKISLSKKASMAISLAFILLIIPSKQFAPSLLYIGKYSGYYNTLRDRYAVIESNDADILEFIPHPYAPILMRDNYFSPDCDNELTDYFHRTCIRLTDRKDGYMNYPTLWTTFKFRNTSGKRD